MTNCISVLRKMLLCMPSVTSKSEPKVQLYSSKSLDIFKSFYFETVQFDRL